MPRNLCTEPDSLPRTAPALWKTTSYDAARLTATLLRQACDNLILTAATCVCLMVGSSRLGALMHKLQAGGESAAGPAAGDEHELKVARLRHERAAREALLRQLDGLRTQKVRHMEGALRLGFAAGARSRAAPVCT